jgi:hypothetical protein
MNKTAWLAAALAGVAVLGIFIVAPGWAKDKTPQLEGATPDINEMAPDVTLSLDKIFGAYTFWKQTETSFESGFIEFQHDLTWNLVVQTETQGPKPTFAYDVKKGTFGLEATPEGPLGVWLDTPGQPREFVKELKILDGHGKSFEVFGRAFKRRGPDEAFFAKQNNPGNVAQSLTIESDPAGALVYLNGDQQAKPTPLTIMKPIAGPPLDVRVEKPGLLAQHEMIVLKAGEQRKVKFALTQGEGSLRIESLPRVKIKLDGNWLGYTPIKLTSIATGKHTIEAINEALGVAEKEEIVLEKGKMFTKNFAFMGRLVVDVGRRCEIWRFGKKAGVAPYDADVPIGRHPLVLVDEKGARRLLVVTVELGKTTTVIQAFETLPKAN